MSQPPPRKVDAARVTAFLKSGTGVVTAATALIVALGGLATAVAKFGDDSSPSPRKSAEAPRAATTVIAESDAQSELRAHIPERIRTTCGTPVDPEPRAVAAFNCKYREVVGVQYNLFASTKELNAAYAAVKRRYAVRANADTCAEGRFEGTRRGGRFLCFVGSDGVAAIVWTDERTDVLSFAWRNDGDLPALAEAWETSIATQR